MSQLLVRYKYIIVSLALSSYLLGCTTESSFNPDKYYFLVNQAELAITEDNYGLALNHYQEAFKHTVKPFGKDVYNAALVSAISGKAELRDEYLQLILNNSDDLLHVRSQFVDQYMTPGEWDKLVFAWKIDYDPVLRSEMSEINKRDQLFRPDYDNFDDTINHNRIININRILDLTDVSGYPSHLELGYQSRLISQEHDIVLHHSAQRRSKDKTVTDLEPILKKAIQQGRFDPERAISYMRFQNDEEKGRFETYNTWQYQHPSLPDSLNSKIWLPKLSEREVEEANTIRQQWYANTIEDIIAKTSYMNQSDHPFIFSSVNKSVANLSNEIPEEEVMLQYQAFTSMMQSFSTQ